MRLLKTPLVVGPLSAILSTVLALFLAACGGESGGSGTTNERGELNDTGITWGGNYPEGNNASCIGETVTIQDCAWGRDSDPATNDYSDGHAGFSFTKLDANGDPLPDQSVDYATQPWACVLDNVTGLVWEMNTDDDGLSGKDWTYTSYDSAYVDDDGSDSSSGGGTDGEWGGPVDTGVGSGSDNCTNADKICTTEQHVIDVNNQVLCGYPDWRMPTRHELHSILYFEGFPSIDTAWFPYNTSEYWSSSPKVNAGPGYFWSPWTVSLGHFYPTHIFYYERNSDFSVMLVRGGS